MKNLLVALALVIAIPLFLGHATGCQLLFPDLFPAGGGTTDTTGAGGDTNGDGTSGEDTNGDGTTGGDTNGDGTTGGTTTTLTIVKTDITVRHDADLECGNDLIGYGTGPTTGVSYIVPSTAPTAGTAVPNTDLYSSKAFAVGGDSIFLVGYVGGSMAYQVSVFDVPSATMLTTFATDDIRLGSIPGGTDSAGHIQADGDYCVVICDQNTVTDGKIIKVIDVSGATPAVVAFDQNPATSHFGVDHVAVDAATKTVVAAADDIFWIYDIDNPTAAPTQIVAPEGIGDTQMKIYGNYIIAVDNQGYEYAFLVDIAGATTIEFTDGYAAGSFNLGIGDTTFAFFADADATDSGQRIAVGTVPGPGFAKPAPDQYIDGSTINNGRVGYGGDVCVTPDGDYVFLSGAYLQYSPGTTAFTVPADPEGVDPYACPAWDIDCSNNTVGFKTATTRSGTTDTTVGYIILP